MERTLKTRSNKTHIMENKEHSSVRSERCAGEAWAERESETSLLLPQLQGQLLPPFCHTSLFFRIKAVKNYCTCYAFLSNPTTVSHITFSVSAATLISPCISLEHLCFLHSPLHAFSHDLGNQSLCLPCICCSALFISRSHPLTVCRVCCIWASVLA